MLKKVTRAQPQLRDNYNKFLQNDLRSNYVKPVEMQNPTPDRVWYLPHLPVENPNKPGHVWRIANTASNFRGQSLNNKFLTVLTCLIACLVSLCAFVKIQLQSPWSSKACSCQLLSTKLASQPIVYCG